MFPAVPRIPTRVLLALFVVGLLAIVTKALITSNGYGARLLATALDVVGTGLLTIAGIGTILDVARDRWWKRRTLWVVVDALDQAIRDVRIIAAEQLFATSAQPEFALGRVDLETAFKLPFTATQRKVVRKIDSAGNPSILALLESATPDPSPENFEFAQRLGALESRADHLWTLAISLYNEVGSSSAEMLLKQTSTFASICRATSDAASTYAPSGGYGKVLVAMESLNTIRFALSVADSLDQIYSEIRESPMPEDLRHLLEERELRRREEDAQTRQSQEEDDEFERMLAEHDRIMDEIVLTDPTAELLVLNKLLSEGNFTADELDHFRRSIAEISETLDETKRQLATGEDNSSRNARQDQEDGSTEGM